MKKGIDNLLKKKRKQEPIVSLTAYDYFTARLEEKAGIDFILVGDSIAMAVFGEETTLKADLEVMLVHTRAVSRGAPKTLVVGDMPFGSYQSSDAVAVTNASRFISEGEAGAVKLEGGNSRMLSRVKAIVDSGIPVMGHVGLLPQSVRKTGGYRVVYRDEKEDILSQAMNLQDAGIFALVVEGVEEEVARELTMHMSVPTIGIGAGRYTDGQILVVNDMLGLSGDFNPKFLKKYADLDGQILSALEDYIEEVSQGDFPAEEHVYHPREGK